MLRRPCRSFGHFPAHTRLTRLSPADLRAQDPPLGSGDAAVVGKVRKGRGSVHGNIPDKALQEGACGCKQEL